MEYRLHNQNSSRENLIEVGQLLDMKNCARKHMEIFIRGKQLD